MRASGFSAVILGALLVGYGCYASAQTIPAAIGADPPADVHHPAGTAALLIPSHGVTLDARGIWGEPGRFSIRNSVQDAAAAIAYLRRPDIAAKYGVYTRRLVIAGHSMGGFCAAAVARTDHRLAGAILIDPWDVGEDGEMLRRHPETLSGYADDNFYDMGHAASSVTIIDLAREVQAARDWNYIAWASDLAGRPLLIIGADQKDGNGRRARLWPTPFVSRMAADWRRS